VTALEREEFLLLTEIAVGEEDQDRLVTILTKRNANIGRLMAEEPDAFADELKECIDLENRILRKLEDERSKIIRKMERVSRSRKAAKSYSSSYPLPFLPRFFNEKG
jgi:hypothetical protein